MESTSKVHRFILEKLDAFVLQQINDGYILGPGIVKVPKKGRPDWASWVPFGTVPTSDLIDTCIPDGSQDVVFDMVEFPQYPCEVRLHRGNATMYSRHKYHHAIDGAIKAVGHIVMHSASSNKTTLAMPGSLVGASPDHEITLIITSGRDMCVVVRDNLGKFVYGVLLDDAIHSM